MDNWTRNDSILLGRMAMQAGISDVDQAYDALMIGARLRAHGFNPEDVDRAVRNFILDSVPHRASYTGEYRCSECGQKIRLNTEDTWEHV